MRLIKTTKMMIEYRLNVPVRVNRIVNANVDKPIINATVPIIESRNFNRFISYPNCQSKIPI